jgi:hypothetical protein
MRDVRHHRTRVILWEWIDARGRRGVLSSARLEQAQLAKLDERLDRIEELGSLNRASTAGYVFPFDKELKKMKIRGTVALRPILVLGPFDREHEMTFLLLAREKNRQLEPSKKVVARKARERLRDILDDPRRRRRHERT